jgi:hypothetical protein
MNSRERFHETMCYGKPDRPPLFNEGIREVVLQDWHRRSEFSGSDLDDVFHYDRRDEIVIDLDHGLKLADCAGRSNGLARLTRSLNSPLRSRIPRRLGRKAKRWVDRSYPLMLRVHHGLFLAMGIEDGVSFIDGMFSLHDHRAFIQRALMLQGEFAARMAEKVLSKISVDAAVFSEPIGTTYGALISPQMYRELVLPTYRPLLDILKTAGVNTIIWRTYANTRSLLECAIEAGFNCLWAVESGSDEMDYRAIRKQFGSDLRLIGGFDLDVLRGAQAGIQRELNEKIQPLLESGGYIPLADGRLREGVTFSNYQYYRTHLQKMVSGL